MATRRNIDGDVMDRIRELALRAWSAAQITRGLALDPRYADRAPHLRTTERIVKEITPDDPSEPWRLADEDDAEGARAVLDVLAEVVPLTEGRRTHVTVNEAKWVKKLSRVARELDALQLYATAREYISRQSRGDDTADLDVWLAFEPWRLSEYGRAQELHEAEASGEEPQELRGGRGEYRRAVSRGWIQDVERGLLPQMTGALRSADSLESKAGN